MARNIAPQDISWFLDLHKRGLIDLKPRINDTVSGHQKSADISLTQYLMDTLAHLYSSTKHCQTRESQHTMS